MKSFKYSSKVVNEIVSRVDNGESKNEVSSWLVVELGVIEDPSKFSWVEKYIRHSGVKFSKPAGNWDACLDYFEGTDEPSKDGLQKALEDHGMTEAQAKKYCSSYWYPLNGMYELYNS